MGNRLLGALSPPTRELLVQRGETVGLPRYQTLYSANAQPEHCYFLLGGMASVITSMRDGSSAEVSVVGSEGVVGGLHLLGCSRVPTTCLMQLTGSGLRVATRDMKLLFESRPDLRARVLECVQEQSSVMSQVAACNRLHEAGPRLARWLLMASDRVGSAELNFTQEFLAELLGARRTTVTMVAGDMQREGLIEYSRGRVRIVNRDGLEAAACECYRVLADLDERLYRD